MLALDAVTDTVLPVQQQSAAWLSLPLGLLGRIWVASITPQRACRGPLNVNLNFTP